MRDLGQWFALIHSFLAGFGLLGPLTALAIVGLAVPVLFWLVDQLRG